MCPKECIWETSNQQPKAMYGNFNCCGTTNDQHSWQSITVCKNSYLKDCIDRLIDREENQKPFQTGPNSMVLGRILLQSNMENPMLPKKMHLHMGKSSNALTGPKSAWTLGDLPQQWWLFHWLGHRWKSIFPPVSAPQLFPETMSNHGFQKKSGTRSQKWHDARARFRRREGTCNCSHRDHTMKTQ
jgi:hypothetical protein